MCSYGDVIRGSSSCTIATTSTAIGTICLQSNSRGALAHNGLWINSTGEMAWAMNLCTCWCADRMIWTGPTSNVVDGVSSNQQPATLARVYLSAATATRRNGHQGGMERGQSADTTCLPAV